MKLEELLKHIPAYGYLRVCEMGQIVGIGNPGSHDIVIHSSKTVGLFGVNDGTLEVNVYEKGR